MPALDEFVTAHPQLKPDPNVDFTPLEIELGWRPSVLISSKWVKRPGHAAEQQCAAMLERLGIAARYEPFLFLMQMRSGGVARGFQPDFWLPEDGMLIELCNKVEAKNQKVLLMNERWPDLPVLVISDAQVRALAANKDLDAESFRQWCSRALAKQTRRIAREGFDPHGYRVLGAELRRAAEAGERPPSAWRPSRVRILVRRRWLTLLRRWL